MSSLRPLRQQYDRFRTTQKAFEDARLELHRLMLVASNDRYRNVEIARALGVSRERVGQILKNMRA